MYLHPDKDEEYQPIIFVAANQINKGYTHFSSYLEQTQDVEPMSEDDFAEYMHETMQQKINLIKLLTEVWTFYTSEVPSQVQHIFDSAK